MFSKLSTVVSILFLVQVMNVQALPEPRTSKGDSCGLESPPHCGKGYVCCGPFVVNPDSGLAFGSCQPEGLICAF